MLTLGKDVQDCLMHFLMLGQHKVLFKHLQGHVYLVHHFLSTHNFSQNLLSLQLGRMMALAPCVVFSNGHFGDTFTFIRILPDVSVCLSDNVPASLS